jgi:hypothetical protein
MILYKIFYQLKIAIHNRKNFKKNKKNITKKKLNFLVEFNAFSYQHIILSYLVNLFDNKFDCNFFSYPSHTLVSYPIENSISKKIKIYVLKLLNLGTYGLYKSLGINNFLEFIIDRDIKSKVKFFIKKKKPKSKLALLNLKVNNVLIGDLAYDTYLKKYREPYPTINVKSEKFLNFFEEFMSLFFIWEKIFKEKKINRVILSHEVYSMGLPARICNTRGGESYLIEFNRFTRHNKFFLHRFSFTKNYKKDFNKFPKKLQKIFTKKAKLKLRERISGSVKDIPYMTKSAFKNNFTLNKNLIHDRKKNLKILISTHDFVDAPHVNGKFIFNDMVEWLEFLVKFSKETNYTWYIKNHPSMNDKWKVYQTYTRSVVDQIIKKSNIILLDSNISHNYLIKKVGINCVLTVSGRIAHEYAYHKIPVINASINNIHSSFKFNFHAKNINHYKYLIKNFSKLKKNLKYNEVLKFYYMHYINIDKNWFFDDLEMFFRKINGYHNLTSYETYKEWLKQFNINTNERIYSRLEEFIESDSLVLKKF